MDSSGSEIRNWMFQLKQTQNERVPEKLPHKAQALIKMVWMSLKRKFWDVTEFHSYKATGLETRILFWKVFIFKTGLMEQMMQDKKI